MEITKAFIDGYIGGVAVGIGMVILAVAVIDALLLAKIYAITATGGAALSIGASIYEIMNNNKKAAIVYGVLAVLSLLNMAYSYQYYYEVWLIGEKGIAAYSTVDFAAAKNMSGGLDSSDQFYKQGGSELGDFMTPHAQKHAFNPNVKSTKNKTQFGENIDVSRLLEDTMLYPDEVIYDPEHNMIKYMKEYDFNISTADTPTGSHRVFINLNPKARKTNRNSQFPYYGGDN